MIKGNNQHVYPNSQGWCVVDESNASVVKHFGSRDDALTYANQCARDGEADVLIHTTPVEAEHVCSVTLPQRDLIRGKGHTSSGDSNWPGDRGFEASSRRSENAKEDSDYDPLLGYDESYFEI